MFEGVSEDLRVVLEAFKGVTVGDSQYNEI
jgi:hypothetical protein